MNLPLLSPDLGPSGEDDLDLILAGLEEIEDEDVLYVEGHGWLFREDAEGLGGLTPEQVRELATL